MRRPDFVEAARHCEAVWPAEGVCAYVARDEGWDFVVLPNVAAHPATTFVIEPHAWMALERRVLERQARMEDPQVWIVHSHVDLPPVLSAADRQAFTVDGVPLLPRLALAVLEVRQGRARLPPSCWRFEGGWTPAL